MLEFLRRRRMKWLATAIGLAGFAVQLPEAAADVAPPPDYVESCTVRNQRRAGEECVLCSDAYHAEPDACERRLLARGYSRRCRTSGASSWEEVWCRSATAQPPPPEDDRSDGFAKPPPDDPPAPADHAVLASDIAPPDLAAPADPPAAAGEAPEATDPPAHHPGRRGCGACQAARPAAGHAPWLASLAVLLAFARRSSRRQRPGRFRP